MHMKYIILHGFKTYPCETIIGPLDEHFNGITGAKGTGKSTILDAICFVLEIPGFSPAEAANLKDLFSKAKLENDDGDVKRAKVSIVFDNTDKRVGKCPKGYENCEEIIISRSIEQQRSGDDDEEEILSTYHLNGATTQKSVVTDLFKSVGLDVNHPDFIIGPKKIMDAMNMKPEELWQLIKAGLGIRMLEEQQHESYSKLDDAMEETIIAESGLKTQLLGYLKAFKRLRRAGLNFSISEDTLSGMELGVETYLAKRRKIDFMKDSLNTMQSGYDDRLVRIMQKGVRGISNKLAFIIKTLLPGSNAKLVPVSPTNLEDGVVIHFSLDGSAWKESLEDLSNEHRLLVALAVLLAVSVYATTPFLILDQIDAFLDEKQTSDLSVLIKEKYSNVQVICISPKREIFTKANVLFTTFMEAGTSEVRRACVEKPKEARMEDGP